ncbi:MAG: helix-turn-helix domain-containing protein [Lachnospiraceae bacterium]|nr:helix-turn-helix domain-containing protein [Lachnospiraceae bacterium]
MNYADPYQKPGGVMDRTIPVKIIASGNYNLSGKAALPVTRPKGRIDYLIIYIASGKAHFFFKENQKETIVSAGYFVLYRPREYQKYAFYGKDNADIYWIHFTGAAVKELLKKANMMNNHHIYYAGFHAEYIRIFRKITSELQADNLYAEEMAALQFRQLMIEISRANEMHKNSGNAVIPEEIEKLIRYLKEHYSDEFVMERYARENYLSSSSLLRAFRKYTGNTPLQFLIDIRLNHAMNLLKTTDCTIGEISVMIGYDNPLYFSRLFSKHVGVSPREYRAADR